MDYQAEITAIASMAEGGRALVNHGSIRSPPSYGIGDVLDALDSLDGSNGNPVIHGYYDCVSGTTVEYPLHANRCSSQSRQLLSLGLFSIFV